MAKKYLLYIHNDKFQNEPQKSALINLLLERHYEYYKPGTLIEEIPATKNFDVSIVGNKELAEIIKPKSSRFSNGVCKIHGLPLDARGRCLQKGCKYS